MSLKNYGVLKGIPSNFRNSWQANNHFQIKMDCKEADFFRIAVNVRSQVVPKDLQYFLNPDFKHTILDKYTDLNWGFTQLESKPLKGSLDYIRANLFDITQMAIIPDEQDGKDNDLNDIFTFYVEKAKKENANIYAFGERWFPKNNGAKDKYFKDIPDQGIHDIHMNQGNPLDGGFANDNGVYQDGGLLFHFASTDKWVALFLKFQSQAIHTNDQTGHPIADNDGVILDDTNENLPETKTPVYIIAALVNPAGEEKGKESIILLNTSAAISLENWKVLDSQKNTMTLSGSIDTGETKKIILTPNLSLGNKGGTITLLNDKGLKVNGVSYVKNDVKVEGEWVKF